MSRIGGFVFFISNMIFISFLLISLIFELESKFN